MTIKVYWNHGSPLDAGEDEARAVAAAEAVLGDADELSASIEFARQMCRVDDLSEMTGLAALWRDAEAAANIAATKGWHDPDGASVYLVAN